MGRGKCPLKEAILAIQSSLSEKSKELEQAKAELETQTDAARQAFRQISFERAERDAATKALAEAREAKNGISLKWSMDVEALQKLHSESQKALAEAENEMCDANEKIEQQRLVIRQLQQDAAKEN